MEKNRRNSIYLAVSLIFILFITILSRVPTLTRTVHVVPLWSYLSAGHWKQILLNIALFVPIGYFLASITRPRYALLIALLVSAAVEAVQFFTYRGMLDVDDLISNSLGASLGVVIHIAIELYEKNSHVALKKWVSWIMIAAGLAGCIMTGIPAAKSSIGVGVTKQFQFSIASIATSEGKTVIEGESFLYDRDTLTYVILVDGKEAATTVDGRRFRASTPALGGKAEVQIRFRCFPVMPTGTWINGDRVEYIPGIEPIIRGVPEEAVLKAWNAEFDVLVYEDQGRILWLIGTEIDHNTEVIYHIHTDEPEKLPANRVQYGFDNRGFRSYADEKVSNELKPIDHYRVFEREIPQGYNVTAVVVGFNTDGTISWNESFRIQ